MRLIDEEYLKHSYYGRRLMAIAMKNKGFNIGEKAVRTAMQMMGLERVFPQAKIKHK